MTTPPSPRAAARPSLLLAAVLAATALAGCAPLIVGTAVVGTGLVVTDRRTTGIQIEDQGIELRASARVRELATLGNVSVDSYNRQVLLTGEVPGEEERQRVERAVAQVENVRGIVNELAVAGNSSVGSRSNDTLIATKVKATFVDAADVQANAIKVVVTRGNVYLMGRVTEREAVRAGDLARAVPGVQRVIRVFELLSEQELANLSRRTASPPAPVSTAAPAAAPAASAPR